MIVRILGSAAGGGLPQWNCRCPNCVAARDSSSRVLPRTQSSLAVSSDGEHWFLLNVSPDIRFQIQRLPAPKGGSGLRGTCIAGCILTDAEIDHTSGLLFLREGETFPIYSSALVRRILNRRLSIEAILGSFTSRPWNEMAMGEWLELVLPSGNATSLRLRAIPLSAHLPRFAREEFSTDSEIAQAVIGLEIEDTCAGGKLLYAPCVETWDAALDEAAKRADAIIVDGTFWSDDELIRLGIGTSAARDMGHLPISGAGGSLERLASYPTKQKIYAHINNTNPILNPDSPEAAELVTRGITVAEDGMTWEIALNANARRDG